MNVSEGFSNRQWKLISGSLTAAKCHFLD